jgi:hypothetical protein
MDDHEALEGGWDCGPDLLPGGECEDCGEHADALTDDDGEAICLGCFESRASYAGCSVEEEHAAERRQMGLVNF